MTQTSQDGTLNGTLTAPRAFGSGYLFGVPLGDLGLFATLLMSFAVGFAAFFAATFVAIVVLLFDKAITGRMPDFTITYKFVGLPAGIVVLALTLAYLGTLWIKRKLRKG
ncbi:hypothetical protein [Edaphobacter dinghuensis]|uniref:Uncharacterized protein n=1 Tax=Edaphobacter dinghuensis TaxID=1560005 RepID=A0A917H4K2_9BACT|nr:hypothetical protein [Edaphobacter dinghuensis]GGG67369.1 hypothetical protein GCM10011585_06570 [Edaphobacter dinghuensis]